MSYDFALQVSEVAHYVLVFSVVLTILYKSYKNFIQMVINIYLIFIVWGILCYIFQGCPLTLFENFISQQIYGQSFYPDYEFTGSDFYFLITNRSFYLPMILGGVMLLINNRYKNAY